MAQFNITEAEYSALRSEERDRMNARLQIWGIYLTLVSVFGVIGAQGGMTGYSLALLPALIACIARFAGHSETILKQIRKRLYQIEQEQNYKGYEHFVREQPRTSRGGHGKALRDTFVLTNVIATIIVAGKLVLIGLALAVIPLVLIESLITIATVRWLRGK